MFEWLSKRIERVSDLTTFGARAETANELLFQIREDSVGGSCILADLVHIRDSSLHRSSKDVLDLIEILLAVHQRLYNFLLPSFEILLPPDVLQIILELEFPPTEGLLFLV